MIGIRTRVTRARLSRRAFLRRVGASAALLPLLDVERARAAGPGGFPKRIVTIAWANGVAQQSFYPPGDDPTASLVLQPLARLKSKVTLVVGVDYKLMVDTGHGADGHFSAPTIFTGTYKNVGGQACTATGPSIDQVVSSAVAKQVNLRRRIDEHGRDRSGAPLQDAVRRPGAAPRAAGCAQGPPPERAGLRQHRAVAVRRQAGRRRSGEGRDAPGFDPPA
jgi:hypothetical protein